MDTLRNYISPSELAELCEEKENIDISRPYTKEEITELENVLTTLVIELDERQRILTDIKKGFEVCTSIEDLVFAIGNRISESIYLTDFGSKELNLEKDLIVSKIRSGIFESKTNAFKLADQDSGVIAYYNDGGDLIYHRSMYPSERQARLFKIKEA